MLDKHRLVHRAFTCSKCGAIAVECRRCAEIAVERELSGISTCAKCNIEEETRD
jgi:ribosomal protein L37AE/L43A